MVECSGSRPPSPVARVAEGMTRKRHSGLGTWNPPLTLAKAASTFNLTALTSPASQSTGPWRAPPSLRAPCAGPAAHRHQLHVPQLTSKSPREGTCGGHPRSVRCDPGWGACVGSACAKAAPSYPLGWPVTRKDAHCLPFNDWLTVSSGALSLWTWSGWSPWKQALFTTSPSLFLALSSPTFLSFLSSHPPSALSPLLPFLYLYSSLAVLPAWISSSA